MAKRLWEQFNNLLLSGEMRFGKNSTIKVDNTDNTTSTINLSELAALDGIAAADLAKIDGITDGTAAASKAMVLDSSGNIAMPDGGFLNLSNAALAAAGSGQSTYAVVADQIVAVTGADATKGVALPAASAGRAILVINTDQTNTLPVAPVNGGNDQINGLTAGTGVFTMGPARAAWFVPTSATQWYVTGDAAIVGTPTEQDLDGLTATVPELNRSTDASARIVTTTATSLSLTVTQHAERIVLVNTNSTFANTFSLPAATGSGVKFTVVNNIVQTQGTVVVAANGTDVLNGVALMAGTTTTAAEAFFTSASSDKVTLNLTTTGGLGGDEVEVWDVAANTWRVKVLGVGSGSLATPFSAT